MSTQKNPTTENLEPVQVIDLRNPYIAGLLAWLVPGLGHWYQGRKAKAVLFAVCIIPIFCIGAYLGSHRELGLVRNVYFSWEPTGWAMPRSYPRPYFIPQACIGFVAIPAFFQAKHVESGGAPFFNHLMAPPNATEAGLTTNVTAANATLDDIIAKLQFSYELGILYTVIAGLLNLLAIFDAIDGPITSRKPEDKKSEPEA